MTTYTEEVIVFLLVALTALSQGAVLRSVPTIDNPCQGDTTSTGTPVYLPIKDQIQLTITAANNADTMCQTFKQSLRSVLTESDTNGLDGPLQNVPGLSMAVGEPAVSASNVFATTLSRNSLNITVIYHFLEKLLANDKIPRFNDKLRDVMSATLAVQCRIKITSQAVASNFTMEESQKNNETTTADCEEFNNLKEAVNRQSLPLNDERRSMLMGYRFARWVQLMMSILKEALEAQNRSLEH